MVLVSISWIDPMSLWEDEAISWTRRTMDQRMIITYRPPSSCIDIVKRQTNWRGSAEALSSRVMLGNKAASECIVNSQIQTMCRGAAKILASHVILQEQNSFGICCPFAEP